MIIQKRGEITVLRPEEGYKYITNDVAWSSEVFLGKFDSVDNWHDTNEEPPEDEHEEEPINS